MKTRHFKRAIARTVFAATAVAVCFSQGTLAADYPRKNIEFVVGYNPGGGYSDWAQALAPVLEKHLPNDVDVLVRHMPGAGSVVAANYVYRSKPDGYTIGIFNMGGLAATQIAREVDYDLTKITWLGRVALDPTAMVVNTKSGITGPQEFKGRERTVMGTKGLAANATITGAVTFDRLGVDWTPLNHKGTSKMVLSVIRGDSDVAWGSYDSVRQYVANGDLRMLLYYDSSRHPDHPDVPIPSDIGLAQEINEAFNSNRLIGAPPGLPADVRDVLAEALAKTVEDPEFQAQLEKIGRSSAYLGAEATTALVRNAMKGFTDYKGTVTKLMEGN